MFELCVGHFVLCLPWLRCVQTPLEFILRGVLPDGEKVGLELIEGYGLRWMLLKPAPWIALSFYAHARVQRVNLFLIVASADHASTCGCLRFDCFCR